MRDNILKALAKLHAQHPWKMVIVVLIITIIMGAFAAQLEQSMRWTDLLPTKSEKTIQYNKVINEFVTATNIIVVVEGEEEKIKAFTEAVVPQIKLASDPKDGKLYTKRSDYKQDVDFIREHGLMLVKADDLQNIKELYQNPNLVPLLTNINNSFEKEYVGKEESISTREKEDNTIIILDGISNLISVMQNYSSGKIHSPEEAQKAIDKLLLGEPYLLSYDKQALIINVIPNFSMTDMSKMISGTDTIQKVIDKVLKDFPGVKAGLTGMIPLGRDEMVYGEKSMGYTSIFDDISMYLPAYEEQQKRIPHIREINQAISSTTLKDGLTEAEFNQLLSELDRLEMNIMEIQDMAFIGGQDKVDRKCSEIVGNPNDPQPLSIITQFVDFLENNRQSGLKGLKEFQKYAAPYFKESVHKMASTENIVLDDLPASILDRYANKNRAQFLITIFPSGNMWTDLNFLQRFTSDLDRVSNKATGMPPVMQELFRVIGNDGKNAAILTVFVVFLLLWLDFRSFKYAIIAMIPLVAGVIWMVGLMHLVGMQLTVVNVMALPMILGIGIDDGVHIVHRWRFEGRGKVNKIFASTGKAIFLTSITTMLAFGSLIFSIWRGFGSLGAAMFIGVGACFLSTVIILSGIIGFLERKNK